MGDSVEVQADVVDKASGMCKVGVVEVNTPKIVPPSVGRPKHQVV